MMDSGKLKLPKKGTPTLDVIFAIILLVATLSTAFCVYQAGGQPPVGVMHFIW